MAVETDRASLGALCGGAERRTSASPGRREDEGRRPVQPDLVLESLAAFVRRRTSQ